MKGQHWQVARWGAAIAKDGVDTDVLGLGVPNCSIEFRVFDDDDNFYASGFADSEYACEEAHDELSNAYGSTRSQIRIIGTKEWQEFIS